MGEISIQQPSGELAFPTSEVEDINKVIEGVAKLAIEYLKSPHAFTIETNSPGSGTEEKETYIMVTTDDEHDAIGLIFSQGVHPPDLGDYAGLKFKELRILASIQSSISSLS